MKHTDLYLLRGVWRDFRIAGRTIPDDRPLHIVWCNYAGRLRQARQAVEKKGDDETVRLLAASGAIMTFCVTWLPFGSATTDYVVLGVGLAYLLFACLPTIGRCISSCLRRQVWQTGRRGDE